MSGISIARRGIVRLVASIVATACLSAGAALAMEHEPTMGTTMSFGRVVEVDADAGTITVEHLAIGHLYMEPMTMVFRVSDRAMLAPLTPGLKIRFEAERAPGGFVIGRIENSNR